MQTPGWGVLRVIQTVTMADGSSQHTNPTLSACMTIDGHRTTVRMIIIDTLAYDIILGMDVLRTIGAQITFGPTFHNKVCTMRLTPLEDNEKRQLDHLINREKQRFKGVKGSTHLTHCDIKLLNLKPIKQR